VKNPYKLKYTWEEMQKFFAFYCSGTYSNKDAFINILKTLDVPEKESKLMWQAFDIASEQFMLYLGTLEEKVWYPRNPQIF
jgi:hypothetical protein